MQDTESVTDTIELSFCGIGSPLGISSAQNCIAVKINNKIYLFDAGARSAASIGRNTLISPDYPGAMRETIEAATNESPCLFLQGASGELGPVEGFVGDPLVADKNGLQLAYASLSTMTKLPAPNKRFEYSGPVISGATLGEWKYNDLPEEQRAKNKCWKIKRKSIILNIYLYI